MSTTIFSMRTKEETPFAVVVVYC